MAQPQLPFEHCIYLHTCMHIHFSPSLTSMMWFVLKCIRAVSTSPVHQLKDINKGTTSSISSLNIKEWLTDSRLTYANGHASFLVTPCPFCDKAGNDNSTTLFINKTTGGSVCKPCNYKGSWADVSQMLKLHKQKHKSSGRAVNKHLQKLLPSMLPKDFWTNNCTPWKSADRGLKDAAIDIFNIKKLKSSNIEKYGLSFTKAEFPQANGVNELLPCIVFPWFSFKEGDLTPERIKMETISSTSDRQVDYMPKDGSPGLFGWNTIPKQASKLVITTQEFDAIAVHQSTGLPAVCLPMGSSSLPPEVLPQLENFTAIYLWFGSDTRGRQASAQFARKLNASRCFIIGPSSEKQQFTSALDAMNKGLDFREIINNAKPADHKQIMTFQQLREEVYSEFLNADQVAGVKWQRFPELNKILKGFRPGELTIFTGPTGSGKTTLMSELSLDLCSQGVSTLWGSFEIRNVRLVKTMLKQFSGINLEKNLSQYQYWADKYQQLPLYYMGFHGPMETTTVTETMAHAVYVHDIQHIIIDNLQFMIGNKLRGFDDSFFAQNHAVAQFRQFASSMNVHVTLIMHPRKEDEGKPLQTSSIFGTAKATQEADNVLILQSQPKKEKYIQITKNRFSGDLGKVQVYFDRSNLSMSGYFGLPTKQQKTQYKKPSYFVNHIKNQLTKIPRVDEAVTKQPIKPRPHVVSNQSADIPSSQQQTASSVILSDTAPTNTLRPLKGQSIINKQLN